MRITLLGILHAQLLFVVLPMSAVAQNDEQWPSLSYLKSDYRRVSAVAHVRVREAEIVNRVGGYEDWRIAGEVIEPFKGKFRKGDTIEYYHGAEAGFRKELFLGDKIVFLQRNFVEKEKRWVWAVLENSTLPYTLDRVQKLRIIKRSMLRKNPARAPKRNPPQRLHHRTRLAVCVRFRYNLAKTSYPTMTVRPTSSFRGRET